MFGFISWNAFASTLPLSDGGDLTAAVKGAADGDIIELAAGSYVLADAGEDLLVDKAITIRGMGSFAADVIIRPDTSTATHRFFSISNENAVVENLTFTGCNILDDDGGEVRRRSPMRLYAGTVRNCEFRDNVQLNHGTLEQFGGFVTGCVFSGNRSKSDSRDHSTGRGGALFLVEGVVSNCVFSGNYARNHGGAAVVYGGLMTHCTVTGNSIDRSGGSGITLAGGTLTDSYVAGNTASGVGGNGKGAVAIITGELRNTVICSNSAPVTACAGVFLAALANNYLNTCEYDASKSRTMKGCRVFANSASDVAAGIYMVSDSTVENCTVYGNVSSVGGGSGLYQTVGTVRSSIFFGNGSAEGGDAANAIVSGGAFTYNCAQPVVAGEGNTDRNPLFMDLAADDVSLRPGSPCIGTGRDAEENVCDMGAVPYAAGVDPVRCGFTVSREELSAAGVVALTGFADGADISGLVFKWDFNGDGVADAMGATAELNIDAAGFYTVTLWMENGDGEKVATCTRPNVVSYKSNLAYVNALGSNTPPFATPETGAHDLQAALDAIAATEENPGEIIVLDGTYTCSATWFTVDKPIYLHSQNGPDTTILRGGWQSGSSVQTYRVMKVEHPKALVAGFTMENGNWNAAANGDEGCGGLRLISGVVSNSVIRNCTGCDWCGGVNVRGGTLTHSAVYGNTAYRGNNATIARAGGIYQTAGLVAHCVISNNTAANSEGGCGLYITGGTTTCSRIVGNYGKYRDTTGAIGVFMSGGCVERSVIAGNGVRDPENSKEGGGIKMSGGTLANCLITGNRSFGRASGVYQTGGTVENCTIVGNASQTFSGSGLYINKNTAVCRNSIIYANGAGIASESLCNLEYVSAKTFANNIVDPATQGTGNSAADPLFTNASAGDYTPASGSPAIDAATDTGLVVDIDGNSRPKDGDGNGVAAPDIGCYEAAGADEGPLRCSFEASPRNGSDCVKSVFTAHVAGTGANGTLAYSWDFGSGTVKDGSASGPTATVEFANYGRHTVSLTVTAQGGATATYVFADCVSVGAKNIYVNNSGSGIWPYASPETATNDIAEAIGSALFLADEQTDVEIDDGDYVIRDKWVVLGANVRVHSKHGPSATRFVPDATRGTTERKAFFLNNALAVLEGVTIDGFNWDGNLKGDNGGVVRVADGLVANCVIQNCRGCAGGAVDMSGGIVAGCILRGNWCVGGSNTGVGHGGGVALVSGAPVVKDTVISNNYVALSGGGIHCKTASAVVTNCVIVGNFTSYSSKTSRMNNTNRTGGGIYTDQAATFVSCVVADNWAGGDGGAVYATQAAKFRNCLIVRNAGVTTRPGFYLSAAGEVVNCTITGNGTNAVAGAKACEVTNAKAVFKNNIVWGNEDCDTELSLAASVESDNWTADPLFRNPLAGDYRLQGNSPCVNAGENQAWMTGATDLLGTRRVVNRRVDIGCYENGNVALMLYVR